MGVEKLSILEDAIFTPIQGAVTSLFAVTRPKVWKFGESYGGSCLFPYGRIEPPSEDGQNAELGKELWETSKVVVKQASSLRVSAVHVLIPASVFGGTSIELRW
jgi:hypothetical protein